MAWGSPISAPRASRRSNCRSAGKALAAIKRTSGALGKQVKAEVAGQGVPAAKIKVFVRVHIRYAGTDTALVVAAGSLPAMKRAFESAHKARFGFVDRSKQMVVEAVSVEAVGGGAKFSERAGKRTRGKLPQPARRTRFFSARRMARGQCLSPATSSSPARRSKAPPSSSSRTRPSSSSPAGRPNSRAKTIWCSRAPKSSSAPSPSAPTPIR